MKKLRLALIDGSDIFRLALEKELQESFEIQHYSDGQEVLDRLPGNPPDIIILDLILAGLDGITLLYKLRDLELRPMVLAATRLDNQYVYEAAEELGIGYVMRKPCMPSAVAARLKDLSKRLLPKTDPAVDAGSYITGQLINLGFSSSHKGFLYLRDCILAVWKQPGIPITKELYPGVGKRYQSTGAQVERAIRSAVNAAWAHRKTPYWNELFAGPDGEPVHPSNGKLISRLADDLRSRIPPEKDLPLVPETVSDHKIL